MGDLLYACVQLVHNMGAAAVVGFPATAWWLGSNKQLTSLLPDREPALSALQRNLTWLTFVAWSTQIASGAGFGVTTYYLKHELPELTGIGLAALGTKIACAIISLFICIVYLRMASRWPAVIRLRFWRILFTLGLTALISAAFLRWYS